MAHSKAVHARGINHSFVMAEQCCIAIRDLFPCAFIILLIQRIADIGAKQKSGRCLVGAGVFVLHHGILKSFLCIFRFGIFYRKGFITAANCIRAFRTLPKNTSLEIRAKCVLYTAVRFIGNGSAVPHRIALACVANRSIHRHSNRRAAVINMTGHILCNGVGLLNAFTRLQRNSRQIQGKRTVAIDNHLCGDGVHIPNLAVQKIFCCAISHILVGKITVQRSLGIGFSNANNTLILAQIHAVLTGQTDFRVKDFIHRAGVFEGGLEHLILVHAAVIVYRQSVAATAREGLDVSFRCAAVLDISIKSRKDFLVTILHSALGFTPDFLTLRRSQCGGLPNLTRQFGCPDTRVEACRVGKIGKSTNRTSHDCSYDNRQRNQDFVFILHEHYQSRPFIVLSSS